MVDRSRREAALTALCICVASVAFVVALHLAATGPAPDLIALAILSVLCAFAANTSVVLPNDSAVSASFMLAVASIVVFHDNADLLGPLVVGMAGGLYLPHIREREWRKFLFNVGSLGLAALAAACVYSVVPSNVLDNVAGQLLAAVPTALTYSLVNFLLLTCVFALNDDRPLRRVADDLWLGDLQIYPFALMGVLLGRLYLELGAWVIPLFVAPILIARQTFASYIALRAAQEATISTLIRALESKDQYTAGHVERVARYAQIMGEELELRPAHLERLRYAALMHDIGKLVVPNHILNKPGRLTPEEFERMRRHEVVSVELLRRIDFLVQIAPSIEAEYTRPTDVTLVPIEARIITVADAYDAMTSTRAYRRALPQDVAFAELREKSGSQFDRVCVEALIRVIEQRGEHHGAGFETDIADFAVPPPMVGTGSAGLGDLEVDEQGVRS
jgi:putative nucleotidyltransferase with HDIG domain